MTLQIAQLVALALYAILIYLVYFFIKRKNYKVSIGIIILGLIMFLVNPVRFKQENVSLLENRVNNKFGNIKERVIVEQKTFEERQEAERQQFKKNYEESRDEIHN